MNANSSESTSHLVYSFPRGENEAIQMALTEYKGRFYIDLRLWFQNEGESVFKPTKKGVSFSVDHLADLKEGVKQLDERLKVRPESPKGTDENRSSNAPRTYPKRPSGTWAESHSR